MRGILLLIAVFAITITSCVSIPKQAPILSEELGLKLQQIQYSHISLLEIYFENRRKEIDQFVIEIWAPELSGQLFKDPLIMKAWKKVINSQNENDRLRFLTIVGPSLQAKINEKRIALIAPIDELERSLKAKINAEYQTAQSINNTLTSFLYSASKVEENRNRYLKKIGVTNTKIDNVIDSTSEAVEQLLSGVNSAKEGKDSINKYLIRIKEILTDLKK